MASTAAERQRERHKRMLEKGFKKRGYYLTPMNIEKLMHYKEKYELESVDDALNKIIESIT